MQIFSLQKGVRIAEQQLSRKEEEVFDNSLRWFTSGLRDQDMLDGASNYVIWKARMSFLLDEYGLKAYIDVVVAVPSDADQQKKYKKEMARVKQLILDGVRDHIV